MRKGTVLLVTLASCLLFPQAGSAAETGYGGNGCLGKVSIAGPNAYGGLAINTFVACVFGTPSPKEALTIRVNDGAARLVGPKYLVPGTAYLWSSTGAYQEVTPTTRKVEACSLIATSDGRWLAVGCTTIFRAPSTSSSSTPRWV